MIFKNSKIFVETDENTGFTKTLKFPGDTYEMNWVLSDSDWGNVDKFQVQSVTEENDRVTINANCQNHSLTINKYFQNDKFIEEYTFLNNSENEWFINKDSFGIHFCFNDVVKKSENYANKICNAHVWCGKNVCWLYGVKLSGESIYPIVNLTCGSISDYSISREAFRTRIGADNRGSVVLNPDHTVLSKGEEQTYRFEICFTEEHPKEYLKRNVLFVDADNFTKKVSEAINFTLHGNGGFSDLKIMCENKNITPKTNGDEAKFSVSFDTCGEKIINIESNGIKTFCVANIIEDFDTIMEKRANFIAKNQQFLKEGSHLDGAYLCYDKDTESMFYEEDIDTNASRERIAMGIIILRQLQKKNDEFLKNSVTKHLEFVERELVLDDGYVCNEIQKSLKCLRLYNFPWFSVYYYEWYKLTKDVRHLIKSAKIIVKYYELGGNKEESQCIEAYAILNSLKSEGLEDLYNSVYEKFISHMDKLLTEGIDVDSDEVGYTSEGPACKTVYLLMAYKLTGDEKYKEKAKIFKKSENSFVSFQPDYHLNSIAVRHWDRYWFGRHGQYGDVFPHYWSMLCTWMYMWCINCGLGDYSKEAENMTGGNLCVYMNDGFASNNYLYPYKINVITKDNKYCSPAIPLGSYLGKSFDQRSNDQDWTLYFAEKLYQNEL